MRDRVVAGHTLLAEGRTAEAEQTLIEALPLLNAIGPHANSFLTLRLLGQCARTTGRLDTARAYYSRALDVAEALGDPDLAGAAVSGMAFVELAADDLGRADEYFRQAVQLVRTLAPGPGRVAVLRNYADLLVRVDDPRAATFYQEALDQPGLDAASRAAMLVSLGRELHRRGRVAAGTERLRSGAALFAEAGVDSETYAALVTLAGLARPTDPAVAADAFARAHDLARATLPPIDVRHYTDGFAARVRQVEAETERRAATGELPAVAPPAVLAASQGLGPDGVRSVIIGAPAMIGQRSLEEGVALTAAGRFADADAKLRMAEVMWSALGAAHVLPRVWVAQARLAASRGEAGAARPLLDRARVQAAALGDARTELAALTALAESVVETAQPRPPGGELPEDLRLLDVVAHASALAEFLAERGEPPETADAAAAALCVRYNAFDLAEHYLRRAAAGGGPEGPRASALAGLVTILTRRGVGRAEEVAALRERLASMADGSADPLVRAAAGGAVGRIAVAAGEWTDATWERLRDACAAYDALRAHPAGPDPHVEPPYLTAAEAAIRLGRFAEALTLCEAAPPSPASASLATPVPAGAVRVVFVPGACGVYALTAVPGRPVIGEVVSSAPGGPSPARCAAVVDAAAALAGPGSAPVVVSALGALYGSAVHRTADGSTRPGVSLLPTASARPPHPPTALPGRRGAVLVDPAGNDSFAGIAGAHAAARWDTEVRPVTAEALGAVLTPGSVVHLAGRVVVDERRPERTALLLTGPEGGPDAAADVAGLAALPWAGTIVVLGPGDGGVPAVLVRTLLEAGALAVVASATAVDGLTTAVLTSWLHDALTTAADDRLTVASVDEALAAVQKRLAAATGDDLLTWAADRPALCAEQLSVITDRAELKRPFPAGAPFVTYG
ncbi:tetratricopeptide repeat protein [Cryptosporangium arvum]|uniref:tetratricopeptide repeat protein n=1 Tax=Cryptosporangium arvum TaxID=80871 RepID=UPI000568E536|nr:tetratricopeptide repeat protein [Cryptosporangium arvum]